MAPPPSRKVGGGRGVETAAAAPAAVAARRWTPSWLGLPSLETGSEGETRATFFRLGSFGLQLEILPSDGPGAAGGARREARGEVRHGAPRVAEPTPLPSTAELEAMTGRQLKSFLQTHLRVCTAGCLDKAELLALAKAGRLRAGADTCQDV